MSAQAPRAEVAPASAAQAKIGALRDKFTGFQSQWDSETKNRMAREEAKLQQIKESMVKLEQTLNSEIKRRVEANKAMQGLFESQIESIQERLEGVFIDRLDKLQASVDGLNDRMTTVERDFTMTREQYIREIEEKNAVVAKDVNKLLDSFENEKIERKEREFAISKKLGDHETKTQAAFEAQQSSREQKYQSLRGELESCKQNREKGDEKFQTFILEEVAAVKNGLVAESHAREQADDDIVQALNHYTKGLQDALRIINQH